MRDRDPRWDEIRDIQTDADFDSPQFGGTDADVFETEREVIVSLAIPGVEREQINLHVESTYVEVRIEKRSDFSEENENTFRVGQSYTGFYRKVPLPAEVDPRRARDTYENDVLEVRIPKKT